MFTQSMPALAQALSGALPDGAVRQLMQALGNCQQPLTHRGAVNVQPPGLPTRGGLARGGTWRPSDYRELLPTAGSGGYVDVPGGSGPQGGGGGNNTHNYEGGQFYFPTDLDFDYIDYYGGDTFNVIGPSTFDYTTHTTVNAGDVTTNSLRVNYINNTYVGEDGRDGRDGRNGRDGAPGPIVIGPGGGGFGPQPLPFVTGRERILKSVTVTGRASVPHVSDLAVKDTAVTVGTTAREKEFTATGQVECPTVKSATLSSISASGTVTIPTVTGVSMSGATAGGTIAYDTYPTATCGGITGTVSVPTTASLSAATASGNISYDTYATATCGAITGTVSVPTSGSFTATPTGIAASGGVGSLAGSVTIPIPTGGYLDAACKLVLTTTNQTYSVSFTGAPSVTVSSQGSVAGTVSLTGTTKASLSVSTPVITLTKTSASTTASLPVTGSVSLSGDTNRSVTISTPTITPNKSSAEVPAKLTVSGGTFSLTSGSTTSAVTVSATGATVSLEAGTLDVPVLVSGSVSVTEPTGSGELQDAEVTWEEIYEDKKVDLTVTQKADFLVYLRPRL